MSSFKEYLKSSAVSFIAGFALAVLPFIGDLSFSKAAIMGLVFVGVRAGVKAVLEVLSFIKPTTSVSKV